MDAQVDLSVCWAGMSDDMFSEIATYIIDKGSHKGSISGLMLKRYDAERQFRLL